MKEVAAAPPSVFTEVAVAVLSTVTPTVAAAPITTSLVAEPPVAEESMMPPVLPVKPA